MADIFQTPPQKSQSRLLINFFTSQSDYHTRDLILGRDAAVDGLRRYLQVPFSRLLKCVHAPPLQQTDVQRIHTGLVQNNILIPGVCGHGWKKLGWDPTAERIYVGEEIQYKFKIKNKLYITTRPIATYGADSQVGHGTRVYEAKDAAAKKVAIKYSWREADRESDGATLRAIVENIRAKFRENMAADAEKHFVRVRVYDDIATLTGEMSC
ncbi:hypothetical protein HYDPIDRAFT_109154 [Hydnomerulius pinastri MD-312]|nr:hypothetical protein HYDPIDRAFT_109154 [Hydnomerulius pinastri MD-312]